MEGAGHYETMMVTMTSEAWIIQVRLIVLDALPNLEIFSADDETTTFALGLRVVVIHLTGDLVLLAPSVTAGRTIASRLESRVQHREVQSFGLTDNAVFGAAELILDHLQ
jgi:hypothetical protein